MGDAPKVVFLDKELGICTQGDLMVLHWHGPSTVENLKKMERAQEAFKSERGGHYAIVAVVYERPLQDAASRQYSQDLMAKQAEELICLGFLMPRPGLVAAFIRALVSGMRLVTQPPYPFEVFGDAAACARWVASHLAKAGRSMSAQEIEATIAADPAKPAA